MSEDESLPDSETEKKSSVSMPPHRRRHKQRHRTGRYDNAGHSM